MLGLRGKALREFAKAALAVTVAGVVDQRCGQRWQLLAPAGIKFRAALKHRPAAAADF
jgi:hypothetical protein